MLAVAVVGVLSLVPTSTVRLRLESLTLDGLRLTADSAGGVLEPVPLAQATLLADVGRVLDSVIVIRETGETSVLPRSERVSIRPADPPGRASSLQLASVELPADSALEVQSEGDGVLRLFLPGGAPRAMTLSGEWWIDSTLIDFGTIGIGRIVIDTRDPILVDILADEARPGVILLEALPIESLHLSRLRPLSDQAETTVRAGRLVAQWGNEDLDRSSSPSFDSFEGAIDSLWIAGGVLQAEIGGTAVKGLRVGGRDRMPSLLSVLPAAQRRTGTGGLLGVVLLALGLLIWPMIAARRSARAVGTGPAAASAPLGGAGTASSRRLAAVWFADIAGFTELSSRDEDGALAVSKELERLARHEVDARGGRIVKLLGDGVLTEFSSTDAAVRAALGLQQAFSRSGVVARYRMALRVGVHVGDIVPTAEGDVLGAGVNVASRIQSTAEPGRVAVSEDVARQLRQRPEFTLVPMDPVPLKGLPGLTQLYEVDSSDPQAETG